MCSSDLTGQLTTAAAATRQDTEQAARGMAEQGRAIRDISMAVTNTVKQIRLIHAANKEHSIVANDLLNRVGEVRRISERNAAGVKRTQGSTNEPAPKRGGNGNGRKPARVNGR